MKQKKIKLSVLLLSIGISVQAQQATTTTGGDASGSGGTVAYSVGQVVYTTNTDASGTVSRRKVPTNSQLALETELNISLTAFPNPTTENLTLQISDYNNEQLSYQLFDMQGKQLSNGQITAQQTQINMNSLPTATYFVNVVNQENKKVQSFKIIKN